MALEALASVVLGVETCTPHGGVALADARGGGLVACRWFYARTGYSRRLAPNIDEILREAGLEREAIAAVAVTSGPGSFTGVRLGLTTAKTLAWSLGVPLFTFSSLERLAARWPLGVGRVFDPTSAGSADPHVDVEATSASGLICAALDARRGEIYSGIYRRAHLNEIEPVREEKVESCANLLDALTAPDPANTGRVYFLGDGAKTYWPQIEARLGARAVRVPEPWSLPSADMTALAGARALGTGAAPTDPLLAAPRYLRISDAQRKYDQGLIGKG